MQPLFDLASGGVYHAVFVAKDAVRSYRTLSALPVTVRPIGGFLSAALSVRSPCPGITRHRVSVKPGLSSRQRQKPLQSGYPAL